MIICLYLTHVQCPFCATRCGEHVVHHLFIVFVVAFGCGVHMSNNKSLTCPDDFCCRCCCCDPAESFW